MTHAARFVAGTNPDFWIFSYFTRYASRPQRWDPQFRAHQLGKHRIDRCARASQMLLDELGYSLTGLLGVPLRAHKNLGLLNRQVDQ